MQEIDRNRGFMKQARSWLDQARAIATKEIYKTTIDQELSKVEDEELARNTAKKLN